MEPIVFGETDGETYDTGAVRLRLLAQSPDQSIAVTDNLVPPGFPGPVRHRHAEMTDIFDVQEGELAFELEGVWRSLGLAPSSRCRRGWFTPLPTEDRCRPDSSTSTCPPATSSI